ncbi:hypothetical protein QLQ09_11775 [Brucella sp. NM4]|nr:hypothetical protein [Brucella sp. NM4]WHS32567.1 hypothetical protein QLQ09_11775 [Brucella sp. NM4]WHT42944.1 hypothetical protein QLQ11_05645 [Ochrobactrum sp. SSR]
MKIDRNALEEISTPETGHLTLECSADFTRNEFAEFIDMTKSFLTIF